MNERDFMKHLDQTYFCDVQNTISYYTEEHLLELIKIDPLKGAKDFIRLLYDNGVLNAICTTKSINIPSYLNREIIEDHITEKCNQIRIYLLDIICSHMTISDSLKLRKYLRDRDILEL